MKIVLSTLLMLLLFTCICLAQSPETSPTPEGSTTPETSPTPEDSATVQPEFSVTPEASSTPDAQPETSPTPEGSTSTTPETSPTPEDSGSSSAETLSIDLLDQLSFKIRRNSKCGKTICHACRKGQSRRFFLNKQGCILCSCE